MAKFENACTCLEYHTGWKWILFAAIVVGVVMTPREDSNVIIQKALEMKKTMVYGGAFIPRYRAIIIVVHGVVYINPIITSQDMLSQDGVPSVVTGYRNDLHWNIHEFNLSGNDSKFFWVHFRAASKNL